MTATLGQLLADAAATLAEAAIDEPRRRARQLLAAAFDLPAAAVLAHPERIVSAAERQRFPEMLRRLAAGEPLSRIVGVREFWGLEFRLSEDTLDPRPDSETLVEAVLARLPDRQRPYRFLDLGTGTGCLLLALLAEYRRASGIGIDISPGAVRTARGNAERLGLAARAGFAVGDWGRAIAGRFDAVVANPPYIAGGAIAALPSEVRDHDPRRALDGGADGLAAYRAIAADLPRLVAEDGLAAVEIGLGQQQDVAAILEAAGFSLDHVARDLAGIARCVILRQPAAPGKKRLECAAVPTTLTAVREPAP